MPIPFKRHILSNGLRLIIHQDNTTPLATCQIIYNAGSRDENPKQTGLAHLLEHFMFCGSKHIPDYDGHLQKVGAINNAYTSQDFTCYYITLPAENLETALWLESDRMLSLLFQEQQLEIQKHVVMEEFKENFLNRPFGDMWLIFNELVFKQHPYQWLPIGKELSHIANVNMLDIRTFYDRFYAPDNAVIAIVGNVDFEKTIALVEKWFGSLEPSDNIIKSYPQEPQQKNEQKKDVFREVPYDMLMKGWKMCGRNDSTFYAHDLLSDMLGSGQSSYLYREFVVNKKLFTDLTAYITATIDPGVFLLIGRPAENITIEYANEELEAFLYNFKEPDQLSMNLQKVKNNVESLLLRNKIKIEDRASTLAISETIDSVERFEKDKDKYFQVSEEQIMNIVNTLFDKKRCNTLFYRKKF